MERRFEWDPEKDAINRREHQVSFDTASLVFLDPFRIERSDTSEHNISGEERMQTIGKVGKVYFVVYTERGENTRLISARPTTPRERRIYNGNGDEDSEGWSKAD